MSDFRTDGCPEIIKEFLYYLETVKNLSPRTVDGYYIDLRTFFRFMKIHRGIVDSDTEYTEIHIDDIDEDFVKSVTSMDIYNYLHFVMQNRKNSANTRSRKTSSLRAYFGYLANKTGRGFSNPLENIDLPSAKKSLPKFLTLDESLELLKSVSGKSYLRDYCIITLLLNCGMRLSELVGINNSDIRDDMIKITGKGNKERLVYLNDACRDAISRYATERDSIKYKHKDEEAFFISQTGSRLTGRRVEQIVEKCLSNAGLSGLGYSTHKLRHTAATLMYQYGGVDMLALKEILGHEHVSTTEIYTHINNEQLKNAMFSSPLSQIKSTESKSDLTKNNDSDNFDKK